MTPMDPTTDRDGSKPIPILDVAALAAAQMRAARAAHEAREEWIRVREAWLHGDGMSCCRSWRTCQAGIRCPCCAAAHYDSTAAAALMGATWKHRETRRVLLAADRAYEAACSEQLAEAQPSPVEQPGLF